MRKRITSILLTLVMLLSLFPGMGMTAAAAEESHPKSVSGMTSGQEMSYFTLDKHNELQQGFDSADSMSGSTPDAKWSSFTQTYSNEEIVGLAYYDPASGRLYVRGNAPCYKFVASTGSEDTMTVIVDGNTTMKYGFYHEFENIKESTAYGLGKLSIEFRNNATLTILNNYYSKSRGIYREGVLEVTSTFPWSHDWTPNSPKTGDLVLSGSGTLAIDSTANAKTNYGIVADNIWIKDNASLNIKMPTGEEFSAYTAIRCNALNIDTTGAVDIDVSEREATSERSIRCSVYRPIEGSVVPSEFGFNLINARSVTLKATERSRIFMNYYCEGNVNINDYIPEYYGDNGWLVTEYSDGDSSHTMQFTHKAEIGEPELVLGGKSYTAGNALADYVVGSGNDKLAVTFKAGPQWFSTWYLNNLIDLNAKVEVWKSGQYQSDLSIARSSAGTSEGDLNITLDVENLKLEAGYTYTIYVSINPNASGTRLVDKTINGSWTFNAIEKPNKYISRIKLASDALYAGDTVGPILERNGGDGGYYIYAQTSWGLGSGAVEGELYSTSVELVAQDGYVFNPDTTRLYIRALFGNTEEGESSYVIARDGKSMTITFRTPAEHKHIWSDWQSDNEEYHYKKCTASDCNAVTDKTVHSWGAWYNYGDTQSRRTCSDCGREELRPKSLREVENFSISIERPIAGEAPSADQLKVKSKYSDVVEVVPGSVQWYDGDTPVTGAFVKGKVYTVKAQFRPIGSENGETRKFGDNVLGSSLYLKGETKSLNAEKTILTYSYTYTKPAYENVTRDVALPNMVIGEAMPLPVVPAGLDYSLTVMYNDGSALTMLTYDSAAKAWTNAMTSAAATAEELTVKPNTGIYYSVAIKWTSEDEVLTLNVTDRGNSASFSVGGTGVSASYDTGAIGKIPAVALMVTEPVYGEAPAAGATIVSGMNYTAGAASWNPADSAFGEKAYTVSIPVVANSGYSFADDCVYTVNGFEASYADGKVSYTFPALSATHVHDTDSQSWVKRDDDTHSRNCSGGDDLQIENHHFGAWTAVDGTDTHKRTCAECGYEQVAKHSFGEWMAVDGTDTHKRTCAECGYEQTAKHSFGEWTAVDGTDTHKRTCAECGYEQVAKHSFGEWTAVDGTDTHKRSCDCGHEQVANHDWVFTGETAPTVNADGHKDYKCSVCNATKQESIAKLSKIGAANVTVAAPAKGEAAKDAATADTAYHIVSTTWEPAVSGAFMTGTAYTVKIALAADGNNRFTNETSFTINGLSATIVAGTEPSADGSATVTISYTFPALSETHVHDTASQSWVKRDDDTHSRNCSSGDDLQIEKHHFGAWTAVAGTDTHKRVCAECGYEQAANHSFGAWTAVAGTDTHKRVCAECGYEQVANHSFGAWTAVDGTDTHKRDCACGHEQVANHDWVLTGETAPTVNADGHKDYKCSVCNATKQESIAKLNKIGAANITVTAPAKGEAAKNAATTDTTYHIVSTVWEPAVSGAFTTGTAYTVKVALAADGNNRFTNETSFTINGLSATIVAGTAPSADGSATVTISYTFPALSETHVHDTASQSWVKRDDDTHSRNCSSGDDLQIEKHHFSAWTAVADTDTHKRSCSACGHEQVANHDWVLTGETAPTVNADGHKDYKCSVCNATKQESIAKLNKIGAANITVAAPVKGEVPKSATTADTAYSVVSTDWEPTVSGAFAPDTVYTVKIVLEVSGNNRFTNETSFSVNGQPVTVVPGTAPTADGTETVTLLYQFPATAGESVSSYAITVRESANGTVTADRTSASAGATVTLTVTPDKGFTLDALSVLDKDGNAITLTAADGKFTFTMPNGAVEVKATFKAVKPDNPFTDVPSGAYYEKAVIWAAEEGITGGTTDTTFSPNNPCTRAHAVTFLWRAAGCPAPKSSVMPFTDVAEGSYYYNAVLWAVENGITMGTTDTTFSPYANCSRGHIVAFLWRSQHSPAATGANPFVDVPEGAYYYNAVLWAVENNVTSGFTATTFGPHENCTRAQIVTFIWRALA